MSWRSRAKWMEREWRDEAATEIAEDLLSAAGDFSSRVERASVASRGRVDLEHGDALRSFHVLIHYCQETAASLEPESPSDRSDDDVLIAALQKIHVDTIRVAKEVHALLCAGFAEGAFARWAFLFECAVVSNALMNVDPPGAERYMEWSRMNVLQTIQEFNRSVGKTPAKRIMPVDEILSVEVELLELQQDWASRGFLEEVPTHVRPFQWLKPAGIPASNIVELAQLLHFDRWLADYHVASRRTSPQWCDHRTYYGAPKENAELLLDDPSAGSDLRHPALLSCASLFQVTSQFLLCRCMSPDGEMRVEKWLAEKSLAIVQALFMATQARLSVEESSVAH